MTTTTDRVTAGLTRLDEVQPLGWESRIDLDAIDFLDQRKTILGQLYGTDLHGLEALGWLRCTPPLPSETAYAHGLCGTPLLTPRARPDPAELAELADEWRRRIGERVGRIDAELAKTSLLTAPG